MTVCFLFYFARARAAAAIVWVWARASNDRKQSAKLVSCLISGDERRRSGEEGFLSFGWCRKKSRTKWIPPRYSNKTSWQNQSNFRNSSRTPLKTTLVSIIVSKCCIKEAERHQHDVKTHINNEVKNDWNTCWIQYWQTFPMSLYCKIEFANKKKLLVWWNVQISLQIIHRFFCFVFVFGNIATKKQASLKVQFIFWCWLPFSTLQSATLCLIFVLRQNQGRPVENLEEFVLLDLCFLLQQFSLSCRRRFE